MREQHISAPSTGPVETGEFSPAPSNRLSKEQARQQAIANLHPDCRDLVALLHLYANCDFSRRAIQERFRWCEVRVPTAALEILAADVLVAEIFPEGSVPLRVLSRCAEIFAFEDAPSPVREFMLPVEPKDDADQLAFGFFVHARPRPKGGRR